METMPIRSARLGLTPLAVSDADEMVGVLGDPLLYSFTGGEPPTLDQLVGRYTAQVIGPPAGSNEEWHNWIVRTARHGRAVGYVQATLSERGTHAEIAWVVGSAFQGNGYASEAVSAMVGELVGANVTEVVAHIHPEHVASNAVAERVGLLPTGRFVDGEREWRLARPAAADTPERPLSVV